MEDRAARLGQLRQRLSQLREGLRGPSREQRQQLTAADRECLRHLGYLVE